MREKRESFFPKPSGENRYRQQISSSSWEELCRTCCASEHVTGQDYIASAHSTLDYMTANLGKVRSFFGERFLGLPTDTVLKIKNTIEEWASKAVPSVNICRPRHKGIPHNAKKKERDIYSNEDEMYRGAGGDEWYHGAGDFTHFGDGQSVFTFLGGESVTEWVEFGSAKTLLAEVGGEPLRGTSQPICAQPLGQPVGDFCLKRCHADDPISQHPKRGDTCTPLIASVWSYREGAPSVMAQWTNSNGQRCGESHNKGQLGLLGSTGALLYAVGLSTQICHEDSDCCTGFKCSLIGVCVAPHFSEIYSLFIKTFVLERGLVTDSSVKIIEDVLSNTFGVKPSLARLVSKRVQTAMLSQDKSEELIMACSKDQFVDENDRKTIGRKVLEREEFEQGTFAALNCK